MLPVRQPTRVQVRRTMAAHSLQVEARGGCTVVGKSGGVRRSARKLFQTTHTFLHSTANLEFLPELLEGSKFHFLGGSLAEVRAQGLCS